MICGKVIMIMAKRYQSLELHTFLGGMAISLVHLGVCPTDFVTSEHCIIIIVYSSKNQISTPL